MARKYNEVITRFTATVSGWEASMRRIESSSDSAARSLKTLEKQTTATNSKLDASAAVLKRAGAAWGAVFSVDAIASFAKSASDYADSFAEVSQRTGIAAESIQVLNNRAALFGGTLEKTTTALDFFNKQLGNAKLGSEAISKVFQTLGVSTTGSPDKVFQNTAAALAKIEDPATKAAMGVQLFGRSAIEVLQAVDDLNGKFDDLSGTLSEETINAIKGYGDTLAILEQKIYALAVTVSAPLIKRMDQLVTALLKLSEIRDFQGLIKANEALARLTILLKDAVYYASFILPGGSLLRQLDKPVELGLIESLESGQRTLEESNRLLESYAAKREDLVARLRDTAASAGADRVITSGESDQLAGLLKQIDDTQERVGFLQEEIKTLSKTPLKIDVDLPYGNETAASRDISDALLPKVPTAAEFIASYEAKVKPLTDAQEAFLTKYWRTIIQTAEESKALALPDLLAILDIESAFGTALKNADTTAAGPGQFVVKTADIVARIMGVKPSEIRATSGDLSTGIRAIGVEMDRLAAATGRVNAVDVFRGYSDDTGVAKLPGRIAQMNTALGDNAGAAEAAGSEIRRLREQEDALYKQQTDLAAQQDALTEKLLAYREGLKSQVSEIQNTLDPVRALRQEYEQTLAILDEASKQPGFGNVDFSKIRDQLKLKFEVDVSNLETAKTAIGNLGVTFTNLKEQSIQAVNDSFTSFIDDVVEGTASAEDAVKSLIKQVAKLALQFAVTNAFKGIAGLFGNAKGAAYGKLALPYGVYTAPTVFALPEAGPLKRYAKGGILGERGAEAVMPLARMANGELGVQSSTVTVQNNVNVIETNDASKQGTVKTSANTNGENIIDVFVSKVKAELQSDVGYGGGFSKVIEQQYGLRRSLGSY